MTLAKKYRECLELKNEWAIESFLKEFSLVESRKYFCEPIAWYCHVIIFVDGSAYIVSYKVFDEEKDTIDYFTGTPDSY